jgi:hypothetical protein
MMARKETEGHHSFWLWRLPHDYVARFAVFFGDPRWLRLGLRRDPLPQNVSRETSKVLMELPLSEELDATMLAEWQQLMLEWRAASEACGGQGDLTRASTPSEVHEGIIDSDGAAALARLQNIKQRIDAFIKICASQRNLSNRDHLVIATIALEQSGVAAGNPNHSFGQPGQEPSKGDSDPTNS